MSDVPGPLGSAEDMTDDQVLALIADGYEDVPATPPAALDVALAAIGLRHVDDELAALTFDSWDAGLAGATRATATASRLMTFTADRAGSDDTHGHDLGAAVGLDVELVGEGEVVLGQITPPGLHDLVLESADGSSTPVETDDAGRFRCAAPSGPIRFRVRGGFVTPWLTR